mgnify:FL=1
MKLELPKKQKMPKRMKIIYIVLICICALAISVAIGTQILGNDVVDNIFGLNKITKRTEEEEAALKVNFESLLDNTLLDKGNYTVQKNNQDKEIIYTEYSKQEKKDNHELDVNLPYINIKNEEVNKFNKEIKNTFEGKAEKVSQNTDENILYTVKYKASIKENILSLIIYSDLKQSSSAQRVIVQTFNYDLSQNKTLTFEDAINEFKLKKNEVQTKINTDIQNEENKSEELIKLGYNVFSRDTKSDIYKVENISEYFIYNNNIYVIFAYGNKINTNEKDIIIM